MRRSRSPRSAAWHGAAASSAFRVSSTRRPARPRGAARPGCRLRRVGRLRARAPRALDSAPSGRLESFKGALTVGLAACQEIAAEPGCKPWFAASMLMSVEGGRCGPFGGGAQGLPGGDGPGCGDLHGALPPQDRPSGRQEPRTHPKIQSKHEKVRRIARAQTHTHTHTHTHTAPFGASTKS